MSGPKLAQTLLPALARSSGCDRLIAMEPIPGPRRVGTVAIHDWAELLAAQPGDVAACAAQASFTRDDLACIIYTSGTGGAPRGVRHATGLMLYDNAACCGCRTFGNAARMVHYFGVAEHGRKRCDVLVSPPTQDQAVGPDHAPSSRAACAA